MSNEILLLIAVVLLLLGGAASLARRRYRTPSRRMDKAKRKSRPRA